MTFWIVLWKIVFIAGVGLFAGMAVWVTIGGFFDARRLFAKIAESDQEDETPRQDAHQT